MRHHHSLFVGLLLLSATHAQSLQSQNASAFASPQSTDIPSPPPHKPIVPDFSHLPLSFESNQGQTDAKVRFLSHTDDGTLFLTPSEAVFSLPAPASTTPRKQSAREQDRTAQRSAEKRRRVALRMQMMGANPKATPLAQQPQPGRINYFLGHDARKWHAGVPTFGRVGFHQVYPGVDVVYYGNQRHLEYDFVIAPHADPKQIQIHFAGAQGVHIDAAGNLSVRVQGQELQWKKPDVYQQDAGTGKHAVTAHFRLKRLPNGQAGVSFALGRYDTARPLVIDPVLRYSTYLTGSKGDAINSIALDGSGNAYLTGQAYSTDFPVTSGAFQTINRATGPNGPSNAFVTKLNPTGTALIYSTYLGGSDSGTGLGATVDGAGYGIAVDSSGNAYVTGYSHATDFPTTTGAFQRVNKAGPNSYNAVLTKLDPSGATLVYSTYLGGATADVAQSIAIDSSGNAYVTGSTQSTNFPTTGNAFQRVNKKQGAASTNGFVTKFNPTATSLVYSTYLGGSTSDIGYGITIDNSGNAYLAGATRSTDFPTTPSAFQTVHKLPGGNAYNAFITKLDPTGSALVYSTYLGGSTGSGFGDGARNIAIDSSGNAYVVGLANSSDFPTTPGAFQSLKTKTANISAAFVTKLNTTGTTLVYSTFLEGSAGQGDTAYGIAIDNNGNAYVSGITQSTDFPTTIGGFQRANKDLGEKAFVSKLNSAGTALIYSTYLGGSSTDIGGSIAIDTSGTATTVGRTSSADFPITAGAFQPTKNQSTLYAGFVTRLSTNPIFPDFNNDGFTDILLQNPTTGAISSGWMHGPQQTGGVAFSLTPPVEYALVGAGDFSGDGNTTLVLQSTITNQIAFWYTSGANNATIPGGNFVNATPPTGWKVVGIGDFNDDGKSDLVFQNQTTHQIAIWFMNGYLYNGGVLLPFTPLDGWSVVGTGDFNADGFIDIVFQNQTTGQIALWYMHGTTYAAGAVMTATPAAGYVVVGVGDYNGDGVADLLFQHQTSNQAAVWYLKNGVFIGGAALSLTPPTDWKIVGPR